MSGFCETEDVRKALQKASSSFGSGSLATDIVESAIEGASNWFARASNSHWYDSGAAAGDLIDTSVASASGVQLDVPSSPHAQDRQQISHRRSARYPVTVAGPYAEIPLPHLHVSNLTKLEVRERGGETTDWVADSSRTSGTGNDYYIQQRGQNSYGRTYLYIHARGIGARTNFDRLLTLEYDYGLDWATEEWNDVRQGIANLAAVSVVDDDNVLAQIPDNGQLIGVDTQHQNLLDAASRRLDPYISSTRQV